VKYITADTTPAFPKISAFIEIKEL
jgi:hypothetical protein